MTKKVIINRFDGGMTLDPRGAWNEAQLVKHFDNFTIKHSLIPYRKSVSCYAAQTTNELQNFIYYNYNTYMLGRVGGSGTDKYAVKLFLKNDLTPTDASAATGGAGSNTTETANSWLVNPALFVEYKDVFWGAYSASGKLWSYTLSTTTLNEAAETIAFTNCAQGIIHSKTDYLYVPLDNKIYYKADSAAFALGLTLPSNLVITSICEYGNYLAIACRPNYYGSVNSKVFLWDLTSTSWNEQIDYGIGDLLVLENLDGYLIGVSSLISDVSYPNSKLIFNKYGGGGAIKFKEILWTNDGAARRTFLPKQKYNNRLFFGLSNASSVDLTNHNLTGIWVVGRNDENSQFSVILDRIANNATEVKTITGFIFAQNYAIISYTDTSDAHGISITTNGLVGGQTTAKYDTISEYRTTLNPGMSEGDKIHKKQLTSNE